MHVLLEHDLPRALLIGQVSFNSLTLRSKFEFSFVAPIPFLQKYWGDVDKMSSKCILCDHVCNTHDHSVLQSIDITRRNLMLITLRALRVKSYLQKGNVKAHDFQTDLFQALEFE